ncbi:hypothetical protein A7U60_g4917 [Sanghuangporus baumii]|uniref:No apical meristem-associated C-terminal domain-containing protein n=1 Tax=Sanghuangporus baumii TaxID=108892 RepID=A0A9Q5N4F2_SANBA|nr:hypothetical protein A7U60_g4917 [Sanghuangporus baumii]
METDDPSSIRQSIRILHLHWTVKVGNQVPRQITKKRDQSSDLQTTLQTNMAPNANANRKVAASSGRNVRNASIKKSNTGTLGIDDLDPIVQPSQSSSDDGMMATIAQKMQTSMEKRKKEREVRFLQAAQLEFSRILSEKAHELQDGVAEMCDPLLVLVSPSSIPFLSLLNSRDKIYASFQDATSSMRNTGRR